MAALYEYTDAASGSGSFFSDVAGEVLGKHKLVYLAADSLWYLADADDANKNPILGLTLESIAANVRGRILVTGYVANPVWAWVVGGDAGVIYASATPGELTQTPPVGFIKMVAVAKTSTSILFNAGLSGGNTVSYDPEHTASYIVWVDGGVYYAKNGHTGAVTTNANATTLINNVLISINYAGKIILKGFFIDLSTINIGDGATAINLTIEGVGVLTGISGNYLNGYTKLAGVTNTTIFLVTPRAGWTNNLVIKDLEIQPKGALGIGINITNTTHFTLQNIAIHPAFGDPVVGIGLQTVNVEGAYIENSQFGWLEYGVNLNGVTTMISFSETSFQANTYGIKLLETTNAVFDKCIIQSNVVGAILTRFIATTFRSCWFESNTNYDVKLIDDPTWIATADIHGPLAFYDCFVDNIATHFIYNDYIYGRLFELSLNGGSIAKTSPNYITYSNRTAEWGSARGFIQRLTLNQLFVESGLIHGVAGSTWSGFGVRGVNVAGISAASFSPAGLCDMLYDVTTGSTTISNIRNSGTATLLNGQTTIAVAHGCSYTPSLGHISIVWGENPSNVIGDWWIDTITATHFTLNGVDPGASNLDFGWAVRKTP